MDWALDDFGELTVPTRIVSGYELVLQRVRLRLGLHLGEWVLDTSQGGDYAGWREQKPAPISEIVQWARREIASTPGVLREIGLSGRLDPATRRVTITGRFLLAPIDGDEIPPEISLEVAKKGNSQPAIITFHRMNP